MAMTLEEKVMKKAKDFSYQNLKFKKGLAVIFKGIEVNAVEYDEETNYDVTLYFKSKASINRVGAALGYLRFNKKRMLEDYERGIKSIDMMLAGNDLWRLEFGSNIYKKMYYHYMNHYSGERYFLTVKPELPLSEEDAGKNTGSSADGDSYEEFYRSLQESIIKREWHYLV